MAPHSTIEMASETFHRLLREYSYACVYFRYEIMHAIECRINISGI